MDYITIPESEHADKQVDHEVNARLNSPRLREACRRQGINFKDLVRKNLDQVKQIYRHENLTRSQLIMVSQHYEKKRQQKLHIVMKERNKMIEDEIAELTNKREFGKGGSTRISKFTSQSTVDDSPKARLELGEMIMKQQEEINELEEEEMAREEEIGVDRTYDYEDYQRRGQEELAKQSAMRSHLSEKAQRGTIELIDDKEFNYQHNVERMMRKNFNKQEKNRLRSMRKGNMGIYKREIEAFMEYELKSKKREFLQDLAVGTKRYQRNLMDSRMTAMRKKDRMNPQEKAMKHYFEEQLRMQQEADKQSRRERDTITRTAKEQSRRWIEKATPSLMRSARMNEYAYQTPKKSTSEHKRLIKENPRPYIEMTQQMMDGEENLEEEYDEGADLRDLSLDNIKVNRNVKPQTREDVKRRRMLLGYYHDPYRQTSGTLGSHYLYYPDVMQEMSKSASAFFAPQRSARYSPEQTFQAPVSPSHEFAMSASNFGKKITSGKTSLFTSPDNKFRRTQDTDLYQEDY